MSIGPLHRVEGRHFKGSRSFKLLLGKLIARKIGPSYTQCTHKKHKRTPFFVPLHRCKEQRGINSQLEPKLLIKSRYPWEQLVSPSGCADLINKLKKTLV